MQWELQIPCGQQRVGHQWVSDGQWVSVPGQSSTSLGAAPGHIVTPRWTFEQIPLHDALDYVLVKLSYFDGLIVQYQHYMTPTYSSKCGVAAAVNDPRII